MKHIEHIGIAVKSIDAAELIYKKILGSSSYKREEILSENVLTSFFQIGDSKVELLESITSDGPVAKFLEKRGEGIHHIAFAVDDIYSEMSRLKQEGFILLSDEPKKGADNKLVCFIHPKDTSGVLIELCQEISQPVNSRG
ncbi:methylmalonyl-CoA epimerase [Pedobacter sp. HMF7647]|uniref:Methylmalonyl-CoA epimerase n=1 Tax=Hufsiella arboris TaxID=2695275 RepID=A0A7K1Y7Y0_9SPHI|nr:methylmalonyl-CoA epimerase [Hufsiella arboris]MXV50219.1 methylmalonyl-CoA epimerase [Hufsiella arboris]